MKTKKKKIGKILLENRLITENILNEALEYQQKTGVGITQYLIANGYINEKELTKCLTEQVGFPYLPIAAYKIPREIIELLPTKIVVKYCLMPIDRMDDIFTVVMANPLDTDAIKEIEEITGCIVQPFVGVLPDIIKSIDRYYHTDINFDAEKKAKIASLFIETETYSGFERRKSQRVTTEIDIRFPLQSTYRKGKIKNLSMGGFLFESDRALSVGTYVTLQIELPKECSPYPFAAVVEIVRFTPLADSKFDIGARLVRIPKEDAKAIIAYAHTPRKMVEIKNE